MVLKKLISTLHKSTDPINHLSTVSTSTVSLWSVVFVARTELRSILHQWRFWFVVILLSAAAMSAYVLSCLVYVNIAPYNVSFIGGTPMYLLGNLDPAYFLFFQAGLLLLVFDRQYRLQIHRLEEVLESKPVTNLEFQLGQTLAYSGLIWAIVSFNVLLMQLFGFGSGLFHFDIADTLQLHSIFNLLIVDTPVALLFWTTSFLLLTKVFHSRLLVLASSVLVMVVYYLWVLNTPSSFVDLISHSSNQTLFISDILPELPSTTSWVMRVGTLLIVLALVGSGAWCYKRPDSLHRVWTRLVPLSALCLGTLVLSAGVLYELNKSSEINSWRKAHLTYQWKDKLDVRTITGDVQIDPSKQVRIDVDMKFKAEFTTPIQTLVFTLNPGYEIIEFDVNETPCEYEFTDGLLEVTVPFEIEPATDYTLNIVAEGKPNPHFAYLNTPYDYLADKHFPIQALHSFGAHGSIFNRDFVALMPGVYWYPIPGPVPKSADDDSLRSDYFDVDLTVELVAQPTWRVVGPGTSRTNSSTANQYVAKSNVPIASIGLFAAEYVEFAHTFENIKLALYLHSKHSQNFIALEQHHSSLLEKFEGYLEDFDDNGVPIPYQSLVFVEVPNKLRTIGGGWRMNRVNSLPSVILLKERGFPTLNVDRLVREVESLDVEPDDTFNSIWTFLYHASENALGIDTLDSAVRDQLWGHLVSASGEHRRALDLIFHTMAGQFTPSFADGLFSIYATAETSRMTGLNLPAAMGIGRSRSTGPYGKEVLSFSEEHHGSRPTIRNLLEQTGLPELNFDLNSHRQDFEVLYLKSKLIHKALYYYFNFRRDRANVERWLSTLRRTFIGTQFSYADATNLAREVDLNFDLFLEDWLAKDNLAAFEVSPGITTRIADNEHGEPRYLYSFEIANTSSTSGYFYSLGRSFQPTVLEGNTSKRLTLLWEEDSVESVGRSFTVDTGLSVNRGPIGIFVPFKNVELDTSRVPEDVLEETDFLPHSTEIIVDDLDTGFVAYQSPPRGGTFRVVPQDWFWVSVLPEIFDGTLPDIDWRFSIPDSRWIRRTEKNAFGHFRRTVAMSSVPASLKVHPVRFEAEIPKEGTWTLDFYVHHPSNRREYGGLANFHFEVENSSNHWGKEFSPESPEIGWKFVADFELTAGKTDVILVGVSRPSIVYADAIRWRKTTKPK